MLESVYHSCLLEEPRRNAIAANDFPYVPIFYKDRFIGGKFHIDILVENAIVLELKAVDVIIPLHRAQLLIYLKLSGKHKGLLINFNSEQVKDQICSMFTPDFFELSHS